MREACRDCGMEKTAHIASWTDGILEPVAQKGAQLIPRALERTVGAGIDAALYGLGVFSPTETYSERDIGARAWCLAQAARERGIMIRATRGPFGFINYFEFDTPSRTLRFEGLPIEQPDAHRIDDKGAVKTALASAGFPVLPGRAFWFWQKRGARAFARAIGFPLVVKPTNGSYSRHVSTNISNETELERAVRHALRYGPSFLVERYLPDARVVRATVVGDDFLACAERIPANVVGDGTHTIRELIDKKNSHPLRGEITQHEAVLFKIVEDATTDALLAAEGYQKNSVPPRDAVVLLQRDPFVRLGADCREVTGVAHPENIALFKDIARHFETPLVGIDFICRDITASWKNQDCAILELNSLPCIEIHHYPSEGTPQNVAGAILDYALSRA